MSKVGILGTGNVAKALAKGLVAAKYTVMIGTRDPKSEKMQEFLKDCGAKSAGSFAEAASFGDIVIVSTLWAGGATQNALKLADPKNFKGKIVIDTTNPLKEGTLELEIGFNNSGGEEVQKWLPEAHVVKAFNCIGSVHMIEPDFKGQRPDMWIAGNDEGSKKTVTELLGKLGWTDHVIDAGDGIKGSRYLEPLCILWCRYAFSTKPPTFNHALAMLRK